MAFLAPLIWVRPTPGGKDIERIQSRSHFHQGNCQNARCKCMVHARYDVIYDDVQCMCRCRCMRIADFCPSMANRIESAATLNLRPVVDVQCAGVPTGVTSLAEPSDYAYG